jgi:ribonuclease R
VHEGEALLGRAMKDKTGGHSGELPAQERGTSSRKAGGQRAGKGAGKRSEARSGGRGTGSGTARRDAVTDRGADRTPESPIQALKAAVKKSAGSASRKQGKKPRR